MLNIILLSIIFSQTQSDGPIAIDNSGFEDHAPIPSNSYKYGSSYTFETTSTGQHWHWIPDTHGLSMDDTWVYVCNPSAGTSFVSGGGAKEGDIVIGLENWASSKDGDGEFGVQTQWSSNWPASDIVTASKTYTLKVWVGNPAANTWSSSSTDGAGYYNLNGWPGYRIELVFGGDGGHVVARDDNSLTIADGYWAESEISYTVPAANPCVDVDGASWNCLGRNIRIKLYNLNDADVFNYANTIFYDDIRLDVSTPPTTAPTISPSKSPSKSPTISPTNSPTKNPTDTPTKSPTNVPTLSPSNFPTKQPTDSPSKSPSKAPTDSPTLSPTLNPTNSPTTTSPSLSPSIAPTLNPTLSPSLSPTVSPSNSPTISPSKNPTKTPTISPSFNPSISPSSSPTNNPSMSPTMLPTVAPSLSPTNPPSNSPTKNPTKSPTIAPTLDPTLSPSKSPSKNPTEVPTLSPSITTTISPSNMPTDNPIVSPTDIPTFDPTLSPTDNPTVAPTKRPTDTNAVIDSGDMGFMNETSVSLEISHSNGQTNNICNLGEVTLELNIHSHASYEQNCQWKAWMNDIYELTENELSNIALSAVNDCYFKMNGSAMQSDARYKFEACISIDNTQYCDDEIVESLPVPIIESFKILPNENSVYLWDTSNTIGIDINANLTNFEDDDTVYTVYADDLILSSGNRTQLIDQSIVVIGQSENDVINITVCGLDINQCHSCLIKQISTNQNEIITNDACALKDAVSEISNYAETQNNTDLQLSAMNGCIEGDAEIECIQECQVEQFEVLSNILVESTINMNHEPRTQLTLNQAIMSFTQVMQIMEPNQIDQPLEDIQNMIFNISQNVNSVEQSDMILCINAMIISMIPDTQMDAKCDAVNKATNMAETMTNKLVTDIAANGEEIYLKSSCDETGVIDIHSHGVEMNPNVAVTLQSDDGLIVGMNALNNSQSSTLNAVSVSGSYAQHCIEQTIIDNNDGMNAMNHTSLNEYVLDNNFVNLTVVNAAEASTEFESCVEVTLPLSSLGCVDTLFFIDEDNGCYSNDGITKINETTFCTTHFTAFVQAKNIKTKCGNEYGINHIIVSSIALFLFLMMQCVVISHFRESQLKLKEAMKSLTNKLLFAMFGSLCAHIIHEIVLIAYYANAWDDVNAISFLILLPSIIHFWVFMIALFSWLKIFYGSSLTKSEHFMQKLKKLFITTTAIFSFCTFFVSVMIANINNNDLVIQMCNVYGVIMSVFVILIAIITEIVSMKLIKNYKMRAKKANANFNQALTKKLSIAGNAIFVSFIIYAVVTLIAIFNEAAYANNDYLYELVIKLSDISSIAVVFYLYSARKKPQSIRSNRPSARLSKELNLIKIINTEEILPNETEGQSYAYPVPIHGETDIDNKISKESNDIFIYNNDQPGASAENLIKIEQDNINFQDLEDVISSDTEESFDMRKYIEQQIRASISK